MKLRDVLVLLRTEIALPDLLLDFRALLRVAEVVDGVAVGP